MGQNDARPGFISRFFRGHRWWIPTGIVLLAAGIIAYARAQPELESNMKNMYTIMVSALSFLLLCGWLLLLSGFRWRVRFLSLGAAVLLVVAFRLTVREDGAVNGAGMPNLTWKWSPQKDASLPALKTQPSATAQVDLKTTHANDYPQFLGPNRDGVLMGVSLERDWNAHPPRQLWRQPIGVGWSSFAVVGANAITQEQRGDQELVVCYDVKTGQPRWIHSNTDRFQEPQGGDGPRATPTISEGRVYAFGGNGILDCLDGANGGLIWSHKVLKENNTENIIWGKSSSPLLVDDLVVVSGGSKGGPSLLAYRKAKGELAWKAGEDMSAYASPVLATLAGKRQIVMLSAKSVTGHNPADGKLLWRYDWPGDWPKVSQPAVVGNDQLFVAAGYGQGCALLQIGPEKDGRQQVSEVWRNRNLKSQFSNNIVRDGFIYGLDDGVLACVDVKTGKRKWKDARYGHGQLLLVGDLLLVQAETPGDIVLLEISPQGSKELARLPALATKTWNHAALAPPYLLVRNDQEAVCYELTMGKPPAGTVSRSR